MRQRSVAALMQESIDALGVGYRFVVEKVPDDMWVSPEDNAALREEMRICVSKINASLRRSEVLASGRPVC